MAIPKQTFFSTLSNCHLNRCPGGPYISYLYKPTTLQHYNSTRPQLYNSKDSNNNTSNHNNTTNTNHHISTTLQLYKTTN